MKRRSERSDLHYVAKKKVNTFSSTIGLPKRNFYLKSYRTGHIPTFIIGNNTVSFKDICRIFKQVSCYVVYGSGRQASDQLNNCIPHYEVGTFRVHDDCNYLLKSIRETFTL